MADSPPLSSFSPSPSLFPLAVLDLARHPLGRRCARPRRPLRASSLLFSSSLPLSDGLLTLLLARSQFTTDYNAGNLTSAMWEDLKPELDNGSFGGVIGKVRLLSLVFSSSPSPNQG